MKSIKKIFTLIVVTLFLVSCDNKPTLQKYYVDHQETKNFLVTDIPMSIIGVDEQSLSESELKTYKSIKKLNFLGFKKNDNNTTTFNNEREKVKNILSDNSYKSLIKYGSNKQGAIVKYLGTDTEIDELVIFGSNNKTGFGIVRVLGDDMNPSKMLNLVEVVKKSKIDTLKLKELINFF